MPASDDREIGSANTCATNDLTIPQLFAYAQLLLSVTVRMVVTGGNHIPPFWARWREGRVQRKLTH